MRVLFTHQGFPGQFKYLAPALARSGHDVVFLSSPSSNSLPKVRQIFYDPARLNGHSTDPLLSPLDRALAYGSSAKDTLHHLKNDGFVPDVMVAHPAWGESLFFKDVFPRTPLLHFLEFFFTFEGGFHDFGRIGSLTAEERAELRMRNVPLLLALNSCDWGYSPTLWQKTLFPREYHHKVSVVHEGINVRRFKPHIDAEFILPSGQTLKQGMEIITFIARNLEPCRGFDVFMRAVEIALCERPSCHVLIFGGDGVSYGPPLLNGQSYREKILEEVRLPLDRVHFFGQAPQSQVVNALAVSAVHVFFTYPFVISWSILEALSAGCVLIGSATGPVMDIIKHEQNGLLVNFFDSLALSKQIIEVLKHPSDYLPLRKAGRQTILDHYNAEDNVAKQMALIAVLAAGLTPKPESILP